MKLIVFLLLLLFANSENKERLIILLEDNRSVREAALYEDAISIGFLPDSVNHINNLKFAILDSLYSLYLPSFQGDSLKNIPLENLAEFFKNNGDYLIVLHLRHLFTQNDLFGNTNLNFAVGGQIYDLNLKRIVASKIWQRKQPIPKPGGCLLSFVEKAENTINETYRLFRQLENELDDIIRNKMASKEFEIKEFNGLQTIDITPYAELANYSKLNLISIMVKPMLGIYGPSGYSSSISYFYFLGVPFTFFPYCLFNDLYQGNLGLTGIFLGSLSGITIEYLLLEHPFGLSYFLGIIAEGYLGSKIPLKYDFKPWAFKHLKFSTTIFYQIGSDPELAIKGFGSKEGIIYHLGLLDLSLFFKTIGLASKRFDTSTSVGGRLEARFYQLPVGLGMRIGPTHRDYFFLRFEFIPSIFATGGYFGPEGIEFKPGWGIETGMNLKPNRAGIILTIGKTTTYSSRWSDFLGRSVDLGGIFFSVGFAL